MQIEEVMIFFVILDRSIYIHIYQGCTPRPAPPRPRGKWLPRGAPAPKIFNSAPPRPAPPQKKRALPRPAPPRKLPRGKNRGKRSYIIKSFWESKTFDQYF